MNFLWKTSTDNPVANLHGKALGQIIENVESAVKNLC